MQFFSRVKSVALDLLFPKFCFGCKKEGLFLCPACEGSLQRIPPLCFVCAKIVPAVGKLPPGRTCLACRRKTAIYTFLSPFSYKNSLMRDLIHGLKYSRIHSLGQVCAVLLDNYLKHLDFVFPPDSVLVPIPLHQARERVRGFNQSFLIASCLHSLLSERGIPVALKPLLLKIKKTKPQIELPRDERLQNLRGAFAMEGPGMVQEKNIFLIDDVKTTGATLEEAASVLKASGAKRIFVLTIAH